VSRGFKWPKRDTLIISPDSTNPQRSSTFSLLWPNSCDGRYSQQWHSLKDFPHRAFPVGFRRIYNAILELYFAHLFAREWHLQLEPQMFFHLEFLASSMIVSITASTWSSAWTSVDHKRTRPLPSSTTQSTFNVARPFCFYATDSGGFLCHGLIVSFFSSAPSPLVRPFHGFQFHTSQSTVNSADILICNSSYVIWVHIISTQKLSTLLSTYFWALPWGSHAQLWCSDTMWKWENGVINKYLIAYNINTMGSII
jgi:hypothetical protein